MSDKDKLIKLLQSWGVPYKLEDDPDGLVDVYVGNGMFDIPADGNKVVGYSGFFTLYTFNADGTLKEMGAWE